MNLFFSRSLNELIPAKITWKALWYGNTFLPSYPDLCQRLQEIFVGLIAMVGMLDILIKTSPSSTASPESGCGGRSWNKKPILPSGVSWGFSWWCYAKEPSLGQPPGGILIRCPNHLTSPGSSRRGGAAGLPSVYHVLPFFLTHDQDAKILKLFHLGHYLIPDLEGALHPFLA